MEEKDIKLLTCPCCEGEATLYKKIRCYFPAVAVMCKECFLKTPDCPTVEMAVTKWNTRKPMDRIVEQMEEKSRFYDEQANIGDINHRSTYIAFKVGTDMAIDIVKAGGKDD